MTDRIVPLTDIQTDAARRIASTFQRADSADQAADLLPKARQEHLANHDRMHPRIFDHVLSRLDAESVPQIAYSTGGIGLGIVRQAVDRGHSVTAFVRAPERLKTWASRIRVVQGDTLNSLELGRAIEGHDGVLSSFGPRLPLSKTDYDLLERFAGALKNAMLNTTVKRVIIVSMAFLFKDAILPPAHLFGRLFFPSVVTDAARMEEIVAKSEFDLTLERPPQLTDKSQTGKYRVREGHLPVFGFKIARADVAAFMIRTVENHAFSRRIVGVSN